MATAPVQRPPVHLDPARLFSGPAVLPPMPGVAREVFERTQRPDADARSIGDLIAKDAPFSVHILKVVNSAYYSLPSPVGSIRFAIAYLGLGEVSRIALTLSVISAFDPKDASLIRDFWTHSYETALISKRILKHLPNVFDSADDLYAAALLHDIGELVYARCLPEHYRAIRSLMSEKQMSFADAEQALELPSHRALGVMLCDHWRLPRTIRRACEFHELSDLESIKSMEDADPMDVAITVADQLSHLLSQAYPEAKRTHITQQVCRVLGLTPEELLVMMGDVYELRARAQDAVNSMV